MTARVNYYLGLAADFSRPEATSPEVARKLIESAKAYGGLKEEALPEIGKDYPPDVIEAENRAWWPTHCEALRQGRADILTAEYRSDLVYFCQDGPFYGLTEQSSREQHWWALIAQPGVRMTWPIVMFHSEFVHFEWACLDTETWETIAKGTVCWVRRGHRGGCYFKSEQLTFYRDVYAPAALVNRIAKGQGA